MGPNAADLADLPERVRRTFGGAGRRRFAACASEATALDGRADAATIARLRAELDAQAIVIGQQAKALAHGRKVFERASAAARIGVWECDLPEQTLRWTDTVYDIFELPRGSDLDRDAILMCYAPQSLATLEAVRTRAIEERGGFHLDAEITTPKGSHRWVRLTATVECEGDVPVRIFGMKQDITEEKLLSDRTRYLAEVDVMTGLANRAVFQARLADLVAGRGRLSSGGALLLVDLDGFKQVNDTLGHAHGDACLVEAARQIKRVCQGAELVARIGGDEFAVLVGAGCTGDAVEGLARRIVEAVGRPFLSGGRSVRIGACVGVAFRADTVPSELFTRADAALYAAKAAGRNTYRVFRPATSRAGSGAAG